jgi:large subunit ribosomal protein L9
MPRTIKLLLTESVDNTGIVGDVVTVRKGYARNYLLPRNLATQPSDALIQQLQAKRAEALKALEELRRQRQALIQRLDGQELVLVRSCNDLGILYGAVTQHDLAVALEKAGYAGIKDREVRLGQPIKRVGPYEITVKFDAELEAHVKLKVDSDRPLDLDKAREDQAAAEAAAAEAKANRVGAEVEAVGEEVKAKDEKAKKATSKEARKTDGGEAKAEKPAKAKK